MSVTQAEARSKQLRVDEDTIDKYIEEYVATAGFNYRTKELQGAFKRIMKLAQFGDEILSTVDIWRPND